MRGYLAPQIHNDARGRLTVVEFADLPWVPKRAYFLSNSDVSLTRGSHAHKVLEQYFLSLQGDWVLRFFDGNSWTECELTGGGSGLLVRPGLWREISTDDPHGVLAVFASQPYSEPDYIRDFSEFIDWKNS